jgi:hypothetical protein
VFGLSAVSPVRAHAEHAIAGLECCNAVADCLNLTRKVHSENGALRSTHNHPLQDRMSKLATIYPLNRGRMNSDQDLTRAAGLVWARSESQSTSPIRSVRQPRLS